MFNFKAAQSLADAFSRSGYILPLVGPKNPLRGQLTAIQFSYLNGARA